MIPWTGWAGKRPKEVELTEEQLELATELRFKSWHYPYEDESYRCHEAYREWEAEARRLGHVALTPQSELQQYWREVTDPLGGVSQFECVSIGLICPSISLLFKLDAESS